MYKFPCFVIFLGKHPSLAALVPPSLKKRALTKRRIEFFALFRKEGAARRRRVFYSNYTPTLLTQYNLFII